MTLQAFCLACTQLGRRRRRLCWRQVSWRRLNLRYVQVESEREQEWVWERERDWARQVFSSSPMCSLLLQREIERTQHDTCFSHTHMQREIHTHLLTESPLWSSRALALSLSRMHTLCKLLLLAHPSTFVVLLALNSTKKKQRKMSRPQNQNHDATKATTTTAGVALFIVAFVVVFRIIVRYVLFVAGYKTSLSRRCLCLLRRRLSLVFSFNFVYFEFSQNFLEFLLHSHSLLLSMAICCYSFSN